jgi:CheY-like chemotaxis protein
MENFNIDTLKNQLLECAKDKSLLLVEDDSVTLKAMQAALKPFFKSIVVAINGKDALEKYKMAGNFDLIISDIVMPDMDGLELSKSVKLVNNKQSIIIISSGSDAQIFSKLIDIGIDSFIAKPFDIKKVMPKIIDLFTKEHVHPKVEGIKNHEIVALENRVDKLTRLLEESLNELKMIKSELSNNEVIYEKPQDELVETHKVIDIIHIEENIKHSPRQNVQLKKSTLVSNISGALSAKAFMDMLRSDSTWEDSKEHIKTIIHQTQLLEQSLKEISQFTVEVENINIDLAEAILEDIAKLFLDISKSVEYFPDLKSTANAIVNISEFFYINKELRGFTPNEVREFLEIDFLLDDIKDFIASVFVTETAKDIGAYEHIFMSIIEILEVSILNADKITHEN